MSTERAAVPETPLESYERLANYWYDAAQEAFRWRDMNADKIDILEAELRSLKAGGISVEQELPPDERDVLLFSPAAGFGAVVGWLKAGGEWRVRFSAGRGAKDVTHWRPLPAAPGEAIAEGHAFEATRHNRNCKEGRHTWVGDQDEVSHCDFCGVFEPHPEPWEIQCGAQDPDGWCCGLSTGHPGDHKFHTSTWPDVFRKSPEAVAQDDPYTACAKAMCEMCEQELELKLSKDKRYWHFVSASGWIPCKASPIWEKVKK